LSLARGFELQSSPMREAPKRLPDQGNTDALRLVRLAQLMNIVAGSADVPIGLIDGPVADHPDLSDNLMPVPGVSGACTADTASCAHGTFVAGILSARRGTGAPAICPECPLLVRPIFTDGHLAAGTVPSTTSQELAASIVECVQSGARILNVSASVSHAHGEAARKLADALDWAVKKGTIVVAAAGNQGTVGSSAITGHRGVLPVASYSCAGQPLSGSNLGASIARRGLGAPGDWVTSLAPGGGSLRAGGTSAAAPFVTGAIALIWSMFPSAPAASIRLALAAAAGRARGVVPPLMDAWGAYRAMESITRR
jgi:subtilisin family serine protease